MGDLPRSGIIPASPASAAGFFTTEPPGKPEKHSLTDCKVTRSGLRRKSQWEGQEELGPGLAHVDFGDGRSREVILVTHWHQVSPPAFFISMGTAGQ